jgi:hypothetical protein
MEHIKSDILRRVEEMSDDEEEEEVHDTGLEDELDDVGGVKVAGDGEESGEDENDDRVEAKATTETILELAYIRDQKLFERDAQTKRSHGRAALKAQTGEQQRLVVSPALIISITGWTDEQIEGWKIMLERNVCIADKFLSTKSDIHPSQRRTRFFRSTSLLETKLDPCLLPQEGAANLLPAEIIQGETGDGGEAAGEGKEAEVDKAATEMR